MRKPGDWLRRTRAGLLGGSACLLLGALGHMAAGGRLPGFAGLLGLLAVLVAVCGALSALRRHRFAATALTLGLAQGVLHLVLHAMTAGHGAAPAAHGADAASPEHAESLGHAGHHGMSAGPQVASGHSMDPGMTWAHTLAALGAAVCLIHGERALKRLSALLVRPLRRAFVSATVPVPPECPRAEPYDTLPAPHGALLARARTRRGPPSATYA
ncbi:hypothetical protein ACIP6P_02605 [Streptomyces sp. NPDC088729]|uniref:hypothetical protein n=1 Tax=Streptomyces sp. NPDC088729 TaxID=3365876 RepID=UPI003801939D